MDELVRKEEHGRLGQVESNCSVWICKYYPYCRMNMYTHPTSGPQSLCFSPKPQIKISKDANVSIYKEDEVKGDLISQL